MNTVEYLLDHIKSYIDSVSREERIVTFDELFSHLRDKEIDIEKNELMGILTEAGWLLPQVTGSALEVKVKHGVEKMVPNQNPNQINVLERMKQGPVKMPRNQNPSKRNQ